ncbi:hypothetical protein [Bradyrhizobium betae]|uniref:DUF1579 domain-containing protein n=1 Tax=Bradyrhizobium betae TaxID=244734 RepID=A0A4Q1UM68_9BRAD|nr:hypothetical protein [Bradyrhizobium betae]RXT36678.1 hypothetical protein B5V03_34135 [Bradyrhizobium betae]
MNPSSIMKTSILALIVSIMAFCNAPVGAFEMPTPEVMKICAAELRSQKGAAPVAWSKKPLPSLYRRAFGRWLTRTETVELWVVHRNSNGSSTITARTLSHQPEERGFLVMVMDDKRVVKIDGVAAFDFAFSPREANGVAGVFFCDKNGPSFEWLWTGDDWRVDRGDLPSPDKEKTE